MSADHAPATLVPNATTRERILTLLSEAGPMADSELRLQYGRRWGYDVSDSGLRTRRAELVRRGLVYDTGERITMRSGRLSIIWAAHE